MQIQKFKSSRLYDKILHEGLKGIRLLSVIPEFHKTISTKIVGILLDLL